MKFAAIGFHTNDVPRLVNFYSKVLGMKAEGDHIHSSFNEVNLAIWNPGSIDTATFKSSERFLTLMIDVDNVDVEYERLKKLEIPITFTFTPRTQPWGVRAFGIKDPDGNNVNFLSPVVK
ncbi:MAG: VOC family protein [Dehalococcoidales bacterium]|nr:VOC family protein [Dehalococcoidales bacterium]